MTAELTGQIERITFFNEENGFTIAKIKAGNHAGLVTVVGNLMSPTPGEILEMKGEWAFHPRFGEQFKVADYKIKVPATVDGIKKYLGSGLIKGLGPVMAERIVKTFGKASLDVIENQIEKLKRVEGIGKKRIAMIKTAWREQREIRDLMLFLQSHGVGTGYAVKIFKQYRNRAIAVVKQNPYRLAGDIFGIGFLKADTIAEKLGFPKDAPLRVEAGILFALEQFSDDGHVFFPLDALIDKCLGILGVDKPVVADALKSLAAEEKIIIENIDLTVGDTSKTGRAVYLARYHVAESVVAAGLIRLVSASKSIRQVNAQKALDWVQRQLVIQLAQNQMDAVRCALENKMMIITGGPGTGKTTITNAVLKIFLRMRAKTLLAAPTGRAAKRLSETTGHEARTIHRLLEFSVQKGGFQRNPENPLECDLLIVDEASMIDTLLMCHLLSAIPPGATLILVGDANQLPSVGAGNILNDIIRSGKIPVVELKEIFRQAKTSRIITNAHKINAGMMPELDLQATDDIRKDFYFIEQEDPEIVLEDILKLVKDRIPQRFGLDPVDDIQVLTPMHKGIVGAANLNDRLQAVLNPGDGGIVRGKRTFRAGDKVMQIKNNYDKDVFNGDIGRIRAIYPEERELLVVYDGRQVPYEYSDLDEIVLAYAVSVHKAQGSEYPAVVVPVLTQHYILLQRNLIYTAVTRGKQLVVVVGTRKAMAIGINNNNPKKRFTYLRQRLSNE